MINRILAVAAMLLLCLSATTAEATTAISYSAPDNTYGWCAGSTTSEAPGCAKEWCEKSSGTDCTLALVCDAGWNATAFADAGEANGFGASCDVGSAFDARIIALANCVVAAQTICWTDATFNGVGDQRSQDDNHDFDLTWYSQGLLDALGYEPGGTDGEFGNKTRTAIRAFQRDLGIEETGALSDDLFYMLLAKNGGVPFLIAGMQSLSDSLTSDEKSRAFSAGYRPSPGRSISEELSLRNTAVQRILFADFLRINGKPCPVPATSATTEDASAGTWTVSCSDGGEFEVFLSADSKTITDLNFVAPEPEVTPEPPPADDPPPVDPPPAGKDKSGPTRGKDKG